MSYPYTTALPPMITSTLGSQAGTSNSNANCTNWVKQWEKVSSFLNLSSQELYQKPFDELSLEERKELWNSIKDLDITEKNFLNELLIAMDNMFCEEDSPNPTIYKYPSSKLRFIAENIFHFEYVFLTFIERKLLQSFLILSNGGPNLFEFKSFELISILFLQQNLKTRFNRVSRVPRKHYYSYKDHNNKFGQRLHKITEDLDNARFKFLLEQQSRVDYDFSYDRLCPEVQRHVFNKVLIEYKAQILQSEEKVPIILDEAAYLLYLTLFKQLSPFARYFTSRFRELLILKQWEHLRYKNARVVHFFEGDPIALAFFPFKEKDLKFLFNGSVNSLMLTENENWAVSLFPNDFPRRFGRLANLQRKGILDEKYLAILFADGEGFSSQDMALIASGPQKLPLHIQHAFMTDSAVFHKAKQFDPPWAGLAIGQGSAITVEPRPNLSIVLLGKVDCAAKQGLAMISPGGPRSPSPGLVDPQPEPSTEVSPEALQTSVGLSATKYESYIEVLDITNESVGESQAATEEKSTQEQVQGVIFEPEDKPQTCSTNNIILTFKYLMKERGEFVWTKFLVKNSSHMTKECVLFALLDSLPIQSAKFVAYKYHTVGKHSVFYAKDCSVAMEMFLRKNLTVYTSVGLLYLVLEIDCKDDDIDKKFFLNSALKDAIGRQLQKDSSHLNLSKFYEKQGLEANVFFPLCSTANLQKVCTIIRSMASTNLVSIDLSNNRLVQMITNKGEFRKYLLGFQNVHTLDLRNNQLNMSALHDLADMPLKKLYLDGNPLCSFYDKEVEYIMDILKIWPNLEILDGCRIVCSGALGIRQHYLPLKGAEDFAQQFLTHYFSIFDSDRRDLLAGLYYSKALLSMTCTVLPDQSTSESANLSFYLSQSRNIKRMSDFSRSGKLIKEGNKAVMEFFKLFRATEHDPSTFCVDVISFTEKSVHLTVSGIFREKGNDATPPRFFSRTVFLANFSGTYLIVNELLFVTNCTTEQAKVPKRNVPDAPVYDLHLSSIPRLTVFTDEQKLGLMKKLSDATGMNVRWSKKCLEDMKWDLRNTLIYFQQFYKEDSIPGDAFL